MLYNDIISYFGYAYLNVMSCCVEFVQKLTNAFILATRLRIVKYDTRILGNYKLAVQVCAQTLTIEQNI